MYLHKNRCLASCPGGFYGTKNDQDPPASTDKSLQPASKRICLPCKAGCPKCHDPANCFFCSSTCAIGTTAGDSMQRAIQQQKKCSTCEVEKIKKPPVLGPGERSGGPDLPIPRGPTVTVVFNKTLPPGVTNATVGNTSYDRIDACGGKTTETVKTVSGQGSGGKSQTFWCTRWSLEREEWITDGCSATGLFSTARANASNESATTVVCKCSVVLPVGTKDESFSGDFSLVTDYAFSRIASTFERETPFETSLAVLLLCGVPTALYILLLVAYRFIPHRAFSYQRGGHLSPEERKEWCVLLW